MKQKLWLWFSLLLNAALIGTLLVSIARSNRHHAPAGTASTSTARDAVRADAHHAVSPTANPSRTSWVDQLRAAGVGESVIARMVVADFQDRWEQRRREMQQQFARGDIDGDALGRFEEQFADEQEAALRAALGDEGFRRWDKDHQLRDFDLARVSLSAAESDAIYDLKKTLARQERDLVNSRRDGELDEDDYNDRRSELETLYQQQVKGALGDQRYADLQGTQGDGEAVMRHGLKAANATDAQISSVMDAERQWTDRRAEFERGLKDHPLTPEEYEVQARALDAARDDQYKQLLGADAFAQFQKNQDSRYELMKRYAATWNLSDADIDHIYGMMQEFDKNSGGYKSRAQQAQQGGDAVDWDGVQQNLHEFTQQTEQALRAYLGDDRFSKLNQNNVLELGR